MRQFSFTIGRSARLSPPAASNERVPPLPPHQPRKRFRRRLDDGVEEAFYTALMRGDVASAKDLLAVMESMEARGRMRFQSQRQGTRLMIDRARKELASRKGRHLQGVR